MEEFFREGTIPVQDLITRGPAKAIVSEKNRSRSMISSTRNIGNASLLTFLGRCVPASGRGTRRPASRNPPARAIASDASTMTRASFPLVSRLLPIPSPAASTNFKVKSGVLKNERHASHSIAIFRNVFQHTWWFRGNKLTEIQELQLGDIGAIAKLKGTITGEYRWRQKALPFTITRAVAELPSTFAVDPNSRADEDKSASPFTK